MLCKRSALVHEAYLKLIGGDQAWEGRAHFFAEAANASHCLAKIDSKGEVGKKMEARRYVRPQGKRLAA